MRNYNSKLTIKDGRRFSLNDGDEVVSALFGLEDDDSDIIIYTDRGYGIRIPVIDIKIYGKAAKGSRQIKLNDNEFVINAKRTGCSV